MTTFLIRALKFYYNLACFDTYTENSNFQTKSFDEINILN